jgi:hypothetical protein
MKEQEMLKFNQWANKWDRMVFTCTIVSFIGFILIYIITNTARG